MGRSQVLYNRTKGRYKGRYKNKINEQQSQNDMELQQEQQQQQQQQQHHSHQQQYERAQHSQLLSSAIPSSPVTTTTTSLPRRKTPTRQRPNQTTNNNDAKVPPRQSSRSPGQSRYFSGPSNLGAVNDSNYNSKRNAGSPVIASPLHRHYYDTTNTSNSKSTSPYQPYQVSPSSGDAIVHTNNNNNNNNNNNHSHHGNSGHGNNNTSLRKPRLDESMLLLDHPPPHPSSLLPSGGGETEFSNGMPSLLMLESSTTTGIGLDLISMSATLTLSLTVAQRLQIPNHVAELSGISSSIPDAHLVLQRQQQLKWFDEEDGKETNTDKEIRIKNSAKKETRQQQEASGLAPRNKHVESNGKEPVETGKNESRDHQIAQSLSIVSSNQKEENLGKRRDPPNHMTDPIHGLYPNEHFISDDTSTTTSIPYNRYQPQNEILDDEDFTVSESKQMNYGHRNNKQQLHVATDAPVVEKNTDKGNATTTSNHNNNNSLPEDVTNLGTGADWAMDRDNVLLHSPHHLSPDYSQSQAFFPSSPRWMPYITDHNNTIITSLQKSHSMNTLSNMLDDGSFSIATRTRVQVYADGTVECKDKPLEQLQEYDEEDNEDVYDKLASTQPTRSQKDPPAHLCEDLVTPIPVQKQKQKHKQKQKQKQKQQRNSYDPPPQRHPQTVSTRTRSLQFDEGMEQLESSPKIEKPIDSRKKQSSSFRETQTSDHRQREKSDKIPASDRQLMDASSKSELKGVAVALSASASEITFDGTGDGSIGNSLQRARTITSADTTTSHSRINPNVGTATMTTEEYDEEDDRLTTTSTTTTFESRQGHVSTSFSRSDSSMTSVTGDYRDRYLTAGEDDDDDDDEESTDYSTSTNAEDDDDDEEESRGRSRRRSPTRRSGSVGKSQQNAPIANKTFESVNSILADSSTSEDVPDESNHRAIYIKSQKADKVQPRQKTVFSPRRQSSNRAKTKKARRLFSSPSNQTHIVDNSSKHRRLAASTTTTTTYPQHETAHPPLPVGPGLAVAQPQKGQETEQQNFKRTARLSKINARLGNKSNKNISSDDTKGRPSDTTHSTATATATATSHDPASKTKRSTSHSHHNETDNKLADSNAVGEIFDEAIQETAVQKETFRLHRRSNSRQRQRRLQQQQQQRQKQQQQQKQHQISLAFGFDFGGFVDAATKPLTTVALGTVEMAEGFTKKASAVFDATLSNSPKAIDPKKGDTRKAIDAKKTNGGKDLPDNHGTRRRVSGKDHDRDRDRGRERGRDRERERDRDRSSSDRESPRRGKASSNRESPTRDKAPTETTSPAGGAVETDPVTTFGEDTVVSSITEPTNLPTGSTEIDYSSKKNPKGALDGPSGKADSRGQKLDNNDRKEHIEDVKTEGLDAWLDSIIS